MLEIFLGCFTFSTKDEKIKVIRDSSNLLVFIQVFHIEEYCLFKLTIYLGIFFILQHRVIEYFDHNILDTNRYILIDINTVTRVQICV